MRAPRPYVILDAAIVAEYGFETAIILQALNDELSRLHYHGDLKRQLGQVRFRPDVERILNCKVRGTSSLPILQWEQAQRELAEAGLLEVDGDEIVMADPFGMDVPKVRLKDKPAGDRHVYVFRDGGGLFKIGITKDIKRRSKELFPASLVCEARVPDALRIENELHEKYAAFRHGGEWFRLPEAKQDELITYVRGLKE